MRAEDVLPDNQSLAQFSGQSVRKGTVAAFVQNAMVFSNPASDAAALAEAQAHIREALPSLKALGFFDVLQVRDEALQRFIDQA